jgi:peptidoglycan L-alanyl-D-glutamate endopeptidase CwlK
MPSFSRQSEARIATCHPKIQLVCYDVIRFFDFTVTCGHRGEAEQNALYEIGRRGIEGEKIVTRAKWGQSKHNKKPSPAIDVAPWPIDWDDLGRFHELAGRMLHSAACLGVPLVWGGHWEKLQDLPHFELRGE